MRNIFEKVHRFRKCWEESKQSPMTLKNPKYLKLQNWFWENLEGISKNAGKVENIRNEVTEISNKSED